MSHCLQQSLKASILSPTETILDWLEKLKNLEENQGRCLDINKMTHSAEWFQLLKKINITQDRNESEYLGAEAVLLRH